jgi:hypothetical protein
MIADSEEIMISLVGSQQTRRPGQGCQVASLANLRLGLRDYDAAALRQLVAA